MLVTTVSFAAVQSTEHVSDQKCAEPESHGCTDICQSDTESDSQMTAE